MCAIGNLANNDGAPFKSTELQILRNKLDALDIDGRTIEKDFGARSTHYILSAIAAGFGIGE